MAPRRHMLMEDEKMTAGAHPKRSGWRGRQVAVAHRRWAGLFRYLAGAAEALGLRNWVANVCSAILRPISWATFPEKR